MPLPIFSFDIAGPDAEALRVFYAEVFDWQLDQRVAFEAPLMAPMGILLRQDPAQIRPYIGVEDITETLQLVEAHGGTIEQPRFEVPGVVVLGLFFDPAGNPLGLVEVAGDAHKVP